MHHPIVSEINSAVGQALTRLSSNSAWRTYSGLQQQTLIDALADLMGTQHIGLASSGTAALEMLLRACRLQTGQEVLLSAYDYPGNIAAIERVGARPVLVDVSPDSWRLDWDSLEAAHRPECRVLIASHLHGQLQEITKLQHWCRERGVWLIQDACQAFGASIDGQKLGQASDASFISFGGSKTISAGRGGAWATNDDCLAQHARLAAGAGSGAFQMSEVQAAIVLAQLPFLDRITELGRSYFASLAEQIAASLPEVQAPWASDATKTAFYQAGWLAAPEIVSRMPFPVGKGFDGFHRRSSRRCRISVPLLNTANVVERTWTLHHQAAFQPLPS